MAPTSPAPTPDRPEDGNHDLVGSPLDWTEDPPLSDGDQVLLTKTGEKVLSTDPDGLTAPVQVRWRREDGHTTVWVRYYSESRSPYWSVECRLTPQKNPVRYPFPFPRSQKKEGQLEILRQEGHEELWGDLPLTPETWFQGKITSWSTSPRQADSEGFAILEDGAPPLSESADDGEPVDEASSHQSPESFDDEQPTSVMHEAREMHLEAEPPTQPCRAHRTPGGTIIRNPTNPQEICQCLWLRACDRGSDPDSALPWIFLSNPQDLPFFLILEGLRGEEHARAKMMQAARVFSQSDVYVDSISELAPPISAYGQLLESLCKLSGDVPISEILDEVNTFLFAFGVGPLSSYLKSPYLAEAEARVWQTLFAVALGAWHDLHLGENLVQVLRVDHFLRVLAGELQDPDPVLSHPEGRALVLCATAVLPQGAVPPIAGCDADPQRSELGWVRALGIGDLIKIFQCLKGYELGEIAGVVNVMPRERFENSDRQLSQHVETHQTSRHKIDDSHEQQDQTSRADLRRELRDLISAESLCSHYNNLSQDYDPPTITLNGTWSGNDCFRERADRQAQDQAQALTRRAASRIVEAVTESRHHQNFEERENLFSRDVDNRQESERLVGIYRWLQKVFQLHLREIGKRLVIELEIADPAACYLDRIRHGHGIELTPPPTLASQGIEGPEDITRSNYRVLSELYGIDDPEPPPAEELTQIKNLQTTPPVGEAELTIPNSYVISDAQVAFVIGDENSCLLGYVGGAAFSYEPPSRSEAPPLSATPPSEERRLILGSAAESEVESPEDDPPCEACPDPFNQNPPAPIPKQGFLPLTELIGTTETPIPAAAFSNAPSFVATVSLTFQLLEGQGLFQAWQIRTYETLIAAFNRCQKSFLHRMKKRIESSSAGRERSIERQELQSLAICILNADRAEPTEPKQPLEPDEPLEPCPTPCCPPLLYSEFFERAFDWPAMTYSFHDCPPPEEPCLRIPLWQGQTLVDLQADALFKSFLHAGSARALVPVRPGSELETLFFLPYGLLWPGSLDSIPLASDDVPLITDLNAPGTDEPEASWCLEIPTSLSILQDGDELPTFPCPESTSSRGPGTAFAEARRSEGEP